MNLQRSSNTRNENNSDLFFRTREKTVHSPISSENGLLIPKKKQVDEDEEEEIDTDLETDRLLGHQMHDDGFCNDKTWTEPNQNRSLLISTLASKMSPIINQNSIAPKSNSSSIIKHGLNTFIPALSSSDCCNINSSPSILTAESSHQTRSLKTSPSISSNFKLLSTKNDHSLGIQTEKTLQKNSERLDDHKESPKINKNNSEPSEFCTLENELVNSPGGSSSDKSKRDEIYGGDKKKKNKNKEGKLYQLILSISRKKVDISFKRFDY